MSNPLGEIFGFLPLAQSERAMLHRAHSLCPFNNKSPNCTKDKIDNPIGVCSVTTQQHGHVITCPYRFRQDWKILYKAAELFFPKSSKWTAIPEVRLTDADGQSAGNIDFVLVQYDSEGNIVDFGGIEVQAVYISGNVRKPFEEYMKTPGEVLDWTKNSNYPSPDFLSSSKKRLVPQLLSKGSIFDAWGKHTAIILDEPFFSTLPKLDDLPAEQSRLHWLVFKLSESENADQLELAHVRTLNTEYQAAMSSFTAPRAGDIGEFVKKLQGKFDSMVSQSVSPTTQMPRIEL
jgi:Restriction endonuclease NotI